ncbi:3-hydroxybutyrate oligomer hydrolase family protein [Beggiatoa leptomitoformis]|uniref:Hydrolase n=1 Tax=Beggiatoa leptomitoformis TaxID=288004 RepID=A0A2N9YCA2_9GAMM|nr:3-hydroxybutyrate oligomer hydrolase family protein [Beggiatoa leptomitoformis]ALG66580.1 hydrolase [Beggiatoa leptomitoformis]AUI68115.1 hydrolase [Beggiatoa leptomitoformis]
MRKLLLLKPTALLLSLALLSGCVDGNATLGVILGLAAAAGIASLGGGGGDSGSSTTTPSPTEESKLILKTYDGFSDDLLTAGVGVSGLRNRNPLAVTDTVNPTATEVRRDTIVRQYQATHDMRTTSGYGTLYGATVPTAFATPSSEDGTVAGKEYLVYIDDSEGKNVSLMVHIPTTFQVKDPCIIATASPTFRGIYSAVGLAGEWGLKNNCAVVYTDKGAGVGEHDLNTNTVFLVDGVRRLANESVSDIKTKPNFVAKGSEQLDLAAYSSASPFRIAYKAAHSQKNPEAQWGTNILNAIEFALYVLNLEENYGSSTAGSSLTADNTLIIAAGTSMGGAAVLQAAEQDTDGLIDGVVVMSPAMSPKKLVNANGFTIKHGRISYFNSTHGRSLFDVLTYQNIYQPCASVNTSVAGVRGRCSALFAEGLLSSTTLNAQIAEARQRLIDYGILASASAISDIYWDSSVYAGLSVLYANAYGRFSVTENLCDYSYAGTNPDTGVVRAKFSVDLADDYQTSSGFPPSSGTELVNNFGNNGKGIPYRETINLNGVSDEYLQGALCLRRLFTGTTGVLASEGTALTGTALNNANRVQQGLRETIVSGNLRGKPAIIVHGQDDALAHVNFTSRSYYGLNKQVEGDNSHLVYVEVTNANHFDAFNEDYELNTQIPLLYYFNNGLDRLYGYLHNRALLPQSQVIPTTLPSTTGNKITASNLPKMDNGIVDCQITFDGQTLNIPDCAGDL